MVVTDAYVRSDVCLITGSVQGSNHFLWNMRAGLSPQYFQQGELCGLCLRVWCVDTICPNAMLNSSLFMIADKCDQCSGNDIVISFQGIQELTGVDANVNADLQVAWEFASCAPLIYGNIKMLPSINNSRKYVGLNFSNLKVPLKSVVLSGINLQVEQDGYWSVRSNQDIPLQPPYLLQLQAVDGQTLRFRIAELVPQSLPANFKA